MRRASLIVVVLLSSIAFPSVYRPLGGQPTTAHALPILSGAKTVGVPNGDFSGVGLGQVGTPPANYNFATAGGPVGTPPANNGFETGDFTGWTVTGSPTIQSGGPNGNYAKLTSGTKIVSSAFTVDSSAQTITFNVAAVSGGTFMWKLVIDSGSGYTTQTTNYFTSCPTTCTNWNIYSMSAAPYVGQSIKVEVSKFIGDLYADDLATGTLVLAGWSSADATRISLESGGPDGAFAQTTTTVTSTAFTVNSQTQNASVDLRVSSTSGTYSVNVLSGASYGTSTTVYGGEQATSSSWATRSFGLGDFSGQSVKLQFVPGYGTTLQIDRAGLTQNALPGWTTSASMPNAQGTDGGQTYAAHVGTILSQQFVADGSGYDGGQRGNWFRIVYRMKWNYNSTPTDIGSTLNIEVTGDSSPWFSAAGMHTGAPYDPTDVWIEKYFFVYNPSSPNSPSPRTVSFRMRGWPGFSTSPYENYEGPPDVASIQMVDGPGQNKILGNPTVKSAMPPGAALMVVDSGGTSAQTNDPVDVTSGNYTQTHTDLAIPGIGVPLSFTRTYSAQAPAGGVGVPSPLGSKWSHNWQAALTEVSSGSVARIALPGGASQTWYYVSGAWKPPAGIEGTLVKNGDGSWTLTTAGQLVYTFDSSGKWSSIRDRNNNTTSLAYDGSSRLATITEAGGRAFTLSYGTTGNGNGRVTSVSDGQGRSVVYGYDANGDLTSITDVMGGTISYQYAGHLLTQGTDAKGNVFVRNTYDQQGRVTQQLDAVNGQTTIAYDTPGAGATRVTDQRGKQTTYYFDQQMRITDVVDNDGNTTSTAWDANNNKTSVTNALSKVWQYTYDSHHNVLTAKDPLLKTWTYTYNSKNDVVTVTDPLSHVTTFGYDTGGNLTSVTNALSKVTSFTVNSQGLVTAVTDPLSHTTSFGYDSYGNRTTVTNALTKTWTTAYDTKGRATSVTDPLSHATSYTYNAANNVVTVTDALSHVTTSTYDANGNVLTVSDANNKVTTYAYDSKDQLTSITDAANGVTTFGYDAVGNLTSKQNPRSKTTSYAYDNLSRLHTETDPLTHVRTYGYDAAGRLTSRQDAKSQTTSYTYNDRNDLTNVTYPDLSYVSFQYNDAGARTQMVDSTGTTAYAYDALARLSSVTFPGSRTVSYGYDDAGRETSITYPGGTNQVTYAFDTANRLSTVTDWNSNATSYAYDDANRMTTATLPNGVVSTSSYDNANRLTGISHVKNGTTLASASYTVDAVGNRSDRTDLAGTQTYGYDNLYRLTSVTYPGPTTTTYSYDAFGNRTQKVDSSGTTSYAYDDADRITSVTPPSPAPVVSYTWDNNGNLTNRGTDSFSWDYEDRMTSATVGGTTWSYAYRGDGLRDSATTGGTTRGFTWDVNAGLPVLLDDGAKYVYGAGLVAQVSGANTYYYVADGLGSTMATTDASGAVVNSYTYDVYGKTTASSGTQANDFQFAGQQTDPTGLQYLRARYYDPETGGFLSRDPLAASPGWGGNGFGYAGGNVPVATDPSGLFAVDESGCAVDDPAYCQKQVDDSWGAVCSGLYYYTYDHCRQALGDVNVFADALHIMEVFYCNLSPACGVLAVFTLPSITGEYQPVDIEGTEDAYKMAKAQHWSAERWNEVMSRGVQYTDENGNDIWLLRRQDGRFDWIIQNPKGKVLSLRTGQDLNGVRLGRGGYGWKPK